MAEYLKRALAARRNPPERRHALVKALAQRQARGGALSALTGGRVGADLAGGASPTEAYLGMEGQARREAREDFMMERQVGRDLAEDTYRAGMLELEGLKAGKTALKTLDSQVAALSKGLEDLVPLEKEHREITAMINRYGEQDIPGVGMFEGGPGTMGRLLRVAQGPEAQLNYAAVERLMATVRRNAIGSQQTQRELANIQQQVGQSGWESEEVFRRAIQKIGEALEWERNNVLTRAGDAAVVEYNRRMNPGALPGAQAAPKPGEGMQIGGFTVEVE